MKYQPKPKGPGCKHITVGENFLYWRTWGAVKKMLALGKFSKAEIESKRHEIHVEALGADISHKDFRREQLDRVLDAFDTYIIGADPSKSRRAVEQPRKRALFAVEDLADQLMMPEDTIEQVAQAHFHRSDWRTWGASDLEKLKLHLTSKARARQRELQHAEEPLPF
jgi:hypothetical protein